MEPIITRHIGTPDLWRLDTYRAKGGYETAGQGAAGTTAGRPRHHGAGRRSQGPRRCRLSDRREMGVPAQGRAAALPDLQRGRVGTRHVQGSAAAGKRPAPGARRADPELLRSGAHLAFIYLRGEFFLGARRVQAAIDEAYEAGYLGRNIFGSDMNLEVLLHRGAGAYINCGEETGLIESLEGKRAYPRIKPPFPANIGAFGMPTVVNNVETLANVRHIVANGADWYNSIGPERNRGTRMWCVSGRVRNPGVYEVPLGIPLRELIFDHAGGLEEGRTLKAVIPGGSSSPILTAEEAMEVNSDFDALQRAGTMGGSGGLMVLDDRVCVVQSSYIISEFYHDESCGQCTPCRQGTGWMTKLLHRIETR